MTHPTAPDHHRADSNAHEHGGPSRRGLLAATAVGVPAVVGLGSMLPAVADPSGGQGGTDIIELPLADAPLVDADGAQVRDLPEQAATMVGVTWPAGEEAPEVQVRGRLEDATWTEWFELDRAEDPESGEAAPGTDIAWLGEVTGLQVRAEIDGTDVTESMIAHVLATSAVAEDDEVAALTGPDVEQQDAPAPTMSLRAASTAPNPATPKLGPGTPGFVPRSSWGADEGSTRSTYSADQLKAVIIHHTAGTNSYSKSQSAQIVRGIHSYHTRTLGWADIGYNILVDKYGQVFEGRSGGLHRNINGAHSYGFNTGSFGISVMGNYSSTSVPSAARTAVARLVGWKLLSTFQTSVYGKASWTPGSGTRFKEGQTISLATMMGHRDVNYTSCPGQSLYSQFGSIRSAAQGSIDGGWKEHLWAFQGAGGASKLGTVVKSAHWNGKYLVTVLTKGLVLQESGGKAAGYATPFAKSWQPSWGRPVRGASKDGSRTIQPFQNGTAALEGSRTRFVSRTFKDVAPERVFFLEIEDLASRGVVKGWGDGTFRPNQDNLRDAMIVFIYRAMGSPAYTPPRTSPFKDVSTDFVFYKELCWAHAEGIAEGWKDGTFRPLEPVKRDAVAAFLYRAAGSPSASAVDAAQFKDVDDSVVFAKEIGWLAKNGIARGWSDGTFRPYANIKRDQMATFVMRWMAHTGRA